MPLENLNIIRQFLPFISKGRKQRMGLRFIRNKSLERVIIILLPPIHTQNDSINEFVSLIKLKFIINVRVQNDIVITEIEMIFLDEQLDLFQIHNHLTL
jgi:hypothetical protein